jgi:L-fucose dehydrogenase
MPHVFTDCKFAMDLNLKNKVVLITGGAKGIGAEIARTAAEEGAAVVIVDKDAEAGYRLEAELSRQSKSKFFALELSTAENSRQAVAETMHAFGQIDVLVNNAGVNDKVGLEHGSADAYLGSLRRNLLHYYDMAHFAVSALKDSRGCIINIASKTAITGQGGTSGYASAKGAILALTREWAVELLSYGIRVNAIVPAEVMTPLYKQWLSTFPDPEKKLQGILSKIPLEKRMTKTSEIAAMAVFLMSEKAGHITGQHLFVDGGYVHLDRAIT